MSQKHSGALFVPKTCQWIDEDEVATGKCNMPVSEGASYCEEHLRQAYYSADDEEVDKEATNALIANGLKTEILENQQDI